MLSERVAGQTEEGPQWAAARQLDQKQGRAELGSRILPMFLTIENLHAQAGALERGIENVPAHVSPTRDSGFLDGTFLELEVSSSKCPCR